MWRWGTCTSHALIRIAVVDRGRMVPMAPVVDALGLDATGRPLPLWIAAWADAEAQRPWPPMQPA
jgi:hypothetical protein